MCYVSIKRFNTNGVHRTNICHHNYKLGYNIVHQVIDIMPLKQASELNKPLEIWRIYTPRVLRKPGLELQVPPARTASILHPKLYTNSTILLCAMM